MTQLEAIKLLKQHAFAEDDVESPEMTNGFLGMLRPFTGELYEKNFHEILKIIETLRNELQDQTIDKEVVSCLWAIVHYSRLWAIDEGGMLRRNHLLTNEQMAQLSTWTDKISEEVMNLLDD